jgi:serine phosphatase RsbU (regulator of sigma subunit)
VRAARLHRAVGGGTDGFTEAVRAGGEMYGVGRLCSRPGRAPAVVGECGDRIVREALVFLGDQPQSDDMCLVSWGRLY